MKLMVDLNLCLTLVDAESKAWVQRILDLVVRSRMANVILWPLNFRSLLLWRFVGLRVMVY